MLVRKLAGGTILAAGTGLACMSGYLAHEGFEAMISIPFIGWLGPCVALSVFGLGIAVESEIRVRNWIGAAILGTVLIGGAALDRYSGEKALAEKVGEVEQANADRKAAFDAATKAQAGADKLVADLDAELALMTGDDIQAAQLRLAGLGLYSGKIDGERGPVTLQAMSARGAEVRPQLATARADAKAAASVVGAGVAVVEAPFDLHDAELYATMVTALSVILAFIGSYVIAGPVRNVDKELGEMEEETSGFEAELFDLAAFLAARNAA